MGRIFLFIFFSPLFTAIFSKDFTCDPSTDCAGLSLRNKVPDKDDCQKYYECLGNGQASPTSFDCNRGEYFVTSGSPPGCYSANECEKNFCSSINTCSIDCNRKDYIPVAGDCGKYYDCNAPNKNQVDCPTGTPYFNGEDCVSDDTECCSVCAYECGLVGVTTVPDPKNCNGYYLCDWKGYKYNICNQGEYYNPAKKYCVEEITTCIPYCPTSSTTSAPTTTTTNCYDDFECPADGEFVYCDACMSQHYVCNGGIAGLTDCDAGEVFDYTISACVPEDDCPTFNLDYIIS